MKQLKRGDLVYIAGPYTQGSEGLNVRRAIEMAEFIREHSDLTPIVPHLSHFWNRVHLHNYEYWMSMDLDIVSHCQALFRVTGKSEGADREVAWAKRKKIPVFYDCTSLFAATSRKR